MAALPPAADPFAEPALPPAVRQATHPALQAARAAIAAPRPAHPRPRGPHDVAMPPSASAAADTVSPSAYAQHFHPGFSDASPPRHAKRPSLFRKSISLLAGQRMSQGAGLQRKPSAAGPLQRKPSALRKSMAWLLGNPPPVRLAPGMGDAPVVDKEGKEAKDPFLGGGGEGSEWDVEGSGRAFWKRFSTAQRRALDDRDPLTQTSKEYVDAQARKNRKVKISIYVFLIFILALITGLAAGIPAAHRSQDSGSDKADTDVGATKRSLVPWSELAHDNLDTSLPGPAAGQSVVPMALPSLLEPAVPRVQNKSLKKRLHRRFIAHSKAAK